MLLKYLPAEQCYAKTPTLIFCKVTLNSGKTRGRFYHRSDCFAVEAAQLSRLINQLCSKEFMCFINHIHVQHTFCPKFITN